MNKILKRITAFLLAASILLSLNAMPVSAAESEQDGTFTVTSMNVDGLPNTILGFNINADGPGSEGTKKISAKMAGYGWDIIGVSEDFNFNTELLSSLTNYSSGTHRGKVSGLTNDTDGLNLIWKNSVSVTGEKCVSWNTHNGFIDNGSDGMIDKGYRYYQATVEENVTVDIYILHMDADSTAGDIAARESQLTQLADAIKASNNGNPIIVMGDTNCRYTRENLKTLFIDAIDADSRFTIQDTWVEKVWNGVYPTYGADAMVAKDKGGTYDYPQAEIVDKIFYINNTDSQVTLTANSHIVATDFTDTDGTALADHWPVVVEFGYTVAKTEPEPCVHDYQVTATTDATCTETGSKTYTCTKCGDSYTKEIPAAGHTLVTDEAKEPTCTEKGLTEGSHCGVCGAIITVQKEVAAAGHAFVDGTCTVCGAADPDYTPDPEPVTSGTLGSFVKDITSGSHYVIAFNGTSGIYALVRDDNNNIVAQKIGAKEGDEVESGLIWTVTEKNGTYTISAEIDGKTQYLAKTNSFTGSGYKLKMQEEVYSWNLNQNNSVGSFRFYTKARYGSTYYLRYFNARQGWIATTSAAGVRLYQVN